MTRYIANPLLEKLLTNNLIESLPTEVVGVCRDNPEVKVLFDPRSECYFLDKVDLQLTNYSQRTDESYLKVGNEWKDENNIQDEQEYFDNQRRKKLVLKYLSNREDLSLMDVGAGSGSFLRFMKSEVKNLAAVEPNSGLRNLISKKDSEIITYENIMDTYDDFDVVTSFHVIEHLSDPFTFFSEMRRVTKNDGVVVIETPSSQDALLKTYKNKSFAEHTFWTEHLIIYSPAVLSQICKKYFSEVKIIPTQRYNLSNHLYWLSQGKPGGHEYYRDYVGEELNELYKDRLRQNQKFDTIVLLMRP